MIFLILQSEAEILVQSFNYILSSISSLFQSRWQKMLTRLCLYLAWHLHADETIKKNLPQHGWLYSYSVIVLQRRRSQPIMLSKCHDLLQKWIDWLQRIVLQNLIYIFF